MNVRQIVELPLDIRRALAIIYAKRVILWNKLFCNVVL